MLTKWAVFSSRHCWPSNDNRTDERPVGKKSNPHRILTGGHAEEENQKGANRDDLLKVGYRDVYSVVNLTTAPKT